ncbi:MAG: response regulator transcription factor [Alcanivoracaceae bacterium]|jgi:DNA-binding response OmpR family regulator|nr:response regulator transcription factor [Alcanivoracaceae bacterium]
MRILIVEDDRSLASGLSRALSADGYTVDVIHEGDQLVPAVSREHFDLVLLDLGLPGLDGVSALRRLRKGEQPVPVIIITARDQLQDRVSGLDAGADDYLVKPFEIDELRARIRARLRRKEGPASRTLVVRDLEIDPDAMVVYRAGEAVALQRREFALLNELASNAGRVLTRDRLEQALYGWTDDVESNALEVHVHHLRKKLGADCIRTVRGVGYTMPGE